MGIRSNLSWSSLQGFLTTLATAHIFEINYLRTQKNRKTRFSNYQSANPGYGADAVQVMTENPYRLARDIRGIGFKTADAIAMKLGIEKTAMIRLRAGIS